MVDMKRAIEFARFVRDANVRLNDARAVELGNKEMLSEELNDMAQQAIEFLVDAGEE